MADSSIKHRLAPRIFSILPPPVWHKLLDINLVIPHWHILSNTTLPHISGLFQYRNEKQFTDDVDYFLKYYKPISLHNLIQYLDGCGQLPKMCFLPTFDDGFKEVYEIIAPILIRKGVTGVFFLTSAAIDNKVLLYPQRKSLIIQKLTTGNHTKKVSEIQKLLRQDNIQGTEILSQISNVYYAKRHLLDKIGKLLDLDFNEYIYDVKPYLTSSQVIDLLNKGFAIGAHSIDHPMYSELNIEEQLYQTFESMRQLDRMFGSVCNAFSFPYRDYDISETFFKRAFNEPQLKITFGIGGLKSYKHPRHIPRISLERTDLSTKYILARQFGRSLLRKY